VYFGSWVGNNSFSWGSGLSICFVDCSFQMHLVLIAFYNCLVELGLLLFRFSLGGGRQALVTLIKTNSTFKYLPHQN
jgi:hypothetical protein